MARHFIASILWLGLFSAGPVHSEISGNTFHDVDSGFSISKPTDWAYVTDPKLLGVDLKNSRISAKEASQLVVFSKEMEKGFAGIKPTVGVRLLKGLKRDADLVKWMEGEMKRHAAHDKFYASASAPLLTTVEGDKRAARAAFTNTTSIKGRQFHVYHVLYAVHSKGKIFLVHMNCDEGLATKYVDAFAEIAGSIQVK